MLILPPGHGKAISSPRQIRGRERWFVLMAGLATAALVVVAIVSIAGGGTSQTKGCLNVTFASSTGAQQVIGCGARARADCAAIGVPGGYSGVVGRELAEQCHAMGLRVG
jgi:hypothetical protein